MMNRPIFTVLLAAGTTLAVGLFLVACGSTGTSGSQGTLGVPTAAAPLRKDGTPIPVRAGNMLGKSLLQIGQIATQRALARGEVRSGIPQVALVRFVNRHDMPTLGLSCPADWGLIEEPPYVLVILKGDLVPKGHRLTIAEPRPVHYIAYLYDLWAGDITFVTTSVEDGYYKRALDDPTIPDALEPTPESCYDYDGPRTLHYGDTAPYTTPVPATEATFAPTPTEFLPSPNPSYAAPLMTITVAPPNPTFAAPIATATK